MLIERKEKKRKEKKSKGLFYLIFALTIIAALTISCKNKPTGTSDFAGFDDTVSIGSNLITTNDYQTIIKKHNTIRSRKAISADGITGYFWGEFVDDGIKYGQGTVDYKGGLPHKATLSPVAFSTNTNKANFNNNDGSIEFQLDNSNTITNIKITLSNNNFGNYGTFDAQFVQK